MHTLIIKVEILEKIEDPKEMADFVGDLRENLSDFLGHSPIDIKIKSIKEEVSDPAE